MKTDTVYLGTWFQRTSLHLNEIYQFLKNKKGIKGLDQQKLDKFWKGLDIKTVNFHKKANFDFLEIKCGEITISITEDGVILLGLPIKKIEKDVDYLGNFYNQIFGPALSYLFSLGAPLPKELSQVKEIYPILIVVGGSTRETAEKLFSQVNDQITSSASSPELEIFFGQTINLFNLKHQTENKNILEELLRNIVFIREFDGQLNNYLNLHRLMWHQISKVRESNSLRYKDFPAVRHQILNFLKTLSFVKARLAQMDDILKERVASINTELKDSLTKSDLYRFEHLKANQGYISHLWQMTIEYVNGTLVLLESLFQENTQRELSALKYITLLGALAGFFGMNTAFPWEERWSNSSWSLLVATGLIFLVAIGFYYLLKKFISHRRFIISEK